MTIKGILWNARGERDWARGAGGVAIFVCYDIKAQFINFSDIRGSFDVTGVRIVGEERIVHVIVVYRRPGSVERVGA